MATTHGLRSIFGSHKHVHALTHTHTHRVTYTCKYTYRHIDHIHRHSLTNTHTKVSNDANLLFKSISGYFISEQAKKIPSRTMKRAKSGDEFEVEVLLTTVAAGKELEDAELGWLDSHGGVLSNGDSGPSPAQSQNNIGSLFFSCWNNFLIISSSHCSYSFFEAWSLISKLPSLGQPSDLRVCCKKHY